MKASNPPRADIVSTALPRSGLDASALADGANRNDHFIYASTPSAGLLLLLQMWPQVRVCIEAVRVAMGNGPGWCRAYLHVHATAGEGGCAQCPPINLTITVIFTLTVTVICPLP